MRARKTLVILYILFFVATPPANAQDLAPPGLRSPQAALLLSTFGTVVPVGLSMAGVGQEGGTAQMVLALSGLIVGPSLGYWYAGEVQGALKGIGLRTLSVGVGFGVALAACSVGCDIWGSDTDGWILAGIAAGVGAVMATVLAVNDIVRVDDRVRARNQRIKGTSIDLGVAYVPETSSPGLQLSVHW
jgi:hypothetical protein